MPLDELLQTDIAAAGVAGWRYLFSRNFRLKKQREWRDRPGRAVFEVLAGVFGMAVTLGLLTLAAYALWEKAHS